MIDMVNQINGVADKDGFLKVIRILAENHRKNPYKFSNVKVDDYLEAIASWVEDFSECPQNDIDWESVDYHLILKLLYVGGIYE